MTHVDTHQHRIREKLKRETGSVICGLLEDQTVIEIMLNADGGLWVERLGKRMELIGQFPHTQARAMIDTVASTLHVAITAHNPVLECEFPLDGSRFAALIPPAVSAPIFAIRKKAIMVFSLADYVMQGIMTEAQRAAIEQAVRDRENILIVGGTGTGKTTLTNAVIRYMVDACPDDRLLIMEDTMELQCSARNAVLMRATEQTNMTSLLKLMMRLRPDRILVGEVRDGAALDLLKAWNTGHPGGVATVHANSASEAFLRLEDMVSEATQAPKQRLIAAAVNLIVSIEKHGGSRRIREILKVAGHDGQYITQSIGGNNA